MTVRFQEALFHTTVNLVDAIIKEPTHVMFLWTRLQERKRELEEGVCEAASAEQFSKVTKTMGECIDNDPEWFLAWVASVSGQVAGNVVEIAKSDSKALQSMVAAETGLLPHFRIPARYNRKSAMKALLDSQSQKYDRTLKRLFQDKGFQSKDHKLNWPTAAYTFDWEQGVLSTITHRRTKEAVEVKDKGITKSYKLQDPWCDHSAVWVNLPVKVPVAGLFPKGKGPLQHPDPMKPAVFKVISDALEEAERLSKVGAASASAAPPVADGIVKELAKSREAEHKVKMTALRAKAKETMAKKVARKSFSFQGDPAQ